MSVYSTQFFAGNLAAGGANLYTTPANMTVVVRDIEAYNSSASPSDFNVGVDVAGLGIPIYLVSQAPSATWHQWSGRAVVNPGQTITAYSGLGGTLLIVSGYLLTH